MAIPIYPGMAISDLCPIKHGVLHEPRGGAEDGSPCLCLECRDCILWNCDQCGTELHIRQDELRCRDDLEINGQYGMKQFLCAHCRAAYIFFCITWLPRR